MHAWLGAAMVSTLGLEEVNARTIFPGNLVPDLGLKGDPEDEFCVYVLASGGKYYVGIEERRFLKQRLTKQFEGRGAHWNKTHAPTGVAYVMPAPHRAAEAYVFFALLAKLPARSLERLGGWTQTSVKPSLWRAFRLRSHDGTCWANVSLVGLQTTLRVTARPCPKLRPTLASVGRRFESRVAATRQLQRSLHLWSPLRRRSELQTHLLKGRQNGKEFHEARLASESGCAAWRTQP